MGLSAHHCVMCCGLLYFNCWTSHPRWDGEESRGARKSGEYCLGSSLAFVLLKNDNLVNVDFCKWLPDLLQEENGEVRVHIDGGFCCWIMASIWMKVAYNSKVLLPYSYLGTSSEYCIQDISAFAAEDEKLTFWQLQVYIGALFIFEQDSWWQ